jgi:HD superfamily phosphohydrolase
VLHALKIDPQSDHVYVEAKGLYAVEEYLQARYYMFRQVYFHRTLRSAEAVLVATLNRARELLRRGALGFRMPGSTFERMLMGEPVTTAEYLRLDDVDLTFHLKQWSSDPDPVLSDLAGRFIDRRLFKAVDINLTGDSFDQFWRRASEVVSQAGFDPGYYLVMDRAIDIPYYGYYSPAGVDPSGLIYVESGDAGSPICEISEISEVVRGMRGYRIDRVCFPMEVSDQVSGLMNEHEGRANTAS